MYNLFMLQITLPDGTKKIYPNATLHEGKIFLVGKRGIGEPQLSFNGEDYDVYYDNYEDYIEPPLLNKSLLKENGLTEELVKRILTETPDGWRNDQRIINCMFTLGENKGGKFCVNMTEETQKAEKAKKAEHDRKLEQKEIPISFDEGIFGLQITITLPKSVWNIASKYAKYHKGDRDDLELAEDMGFFDPYTEELKGWFYSVEAIDAYIKAGYPVKYRGYPVNSSADINKIKQKIALDREKKQLRIKEGKAISSLLHEITNNATLISEEEAEEVSKLPMQLFKSLNIDGPSIYGTGEWLHITDRALYHVRNNGMDGDNWALNNYPTGGAGAICVKADINDPKVEEFLRRAKIFSGIE